MSIVVQLSGWVVYLWLVWIGWHVVSFNWVGWFLLAYGFIELVGGGIKVVW